MGLNGTFPDCGEGIPPCVGVDEIGVDDAPGVVVLSGIKTTASSTVDPTGCYTVF